MPAPIIPYEPCNIPSEICEELNRRKVNRSFAYVDSNEKGAWDESSGDWNKYRGPMSPWVRFCSNGNGQPTTVLDEFLTETFTTFEKPGFIFFGGKDFYRGYGFTTPEGGESIIGYVPDKSNTPHIIDNNLDTSHYPIHVPAPEIERISITIQKELYRRASIEWTCFSKAQLEYMTPYFLIPGISCILEWGWNHFNPSSLLDLTNTTDLKKRFNNPYPLYTKNIIESRGNYDVIIGIITHFEWAMEGNKIKCKTEITSKDRIYAGLLTDSIIMDNKNNKGNKNEVPDPLGDLKKFINEDFDKFRSVNVIDDINNITIPNDNPFPSNSPVGKSTGFASFGVVTVGTETPTSASKIMDLKRIKLMSDPKTSPFINYVKSKHNNWKDYVYGVFYGRGENSNYYEGKSDNDFDIKSKGKELWINLGLVIEAVNFHSAPLTGMKNEEMFRIDIDDVVIGGHPNLMSTKGDVCLIPNSEAPKYFYGKYGYGNNNIDTIENYRKALQSHDIEFPFTLSFDDAKKNGQLADIRIKHICKAMDGIYRDNIDEIINEIRYLNKNAQNISKGGDSQFAFPFKSDVSVTTPDGIYPARYSGYLKNIYVNLDLLKTIINDTGIHSYAKFVEKILENINSACGNFWDFRLVGGTGKNGQTDDEIATMKVVDYKFMSTINRGKVFTFDYFDADSLLLGLNFKPTISNAQAIRSMYAPTNHPDKRFTLTNGTNELLDYQFTDRLIDDDDNKGISPNVERDTSGFKDLMRQLQKVEPSLSAYQVTFLDKKAKTTAVRKDTGPDLTPAPVPRQPSPYNSLIERQEQIDKSRATAKTEKFGFKIVKRLVLPSSEVLDLLLDDGDDEKNPKYTGIMPGIQATFTVQGIGGLRTFMMFFVRNLPEPYSHKDIVFRIVDVQETIEAGKWVTNITAGVIPLRPYIKVRLGIT